MEIKRTPLAELVSALDDLFQVADWDQDPAMSRWLPWVYQQIGYNYADTLESDFCQRHNGLMLRSGDTVKEVYCAAFPSPEIVECVLAATSGDALLFLHHPVDMEISGRGFLPVLPDDLRRLQAEGVSIYACHAPMDCHDEIGTNAAIVQALDVQVEQSFAPYGLGYAGRLGSIPPTSLEGLISRGQEVFGVDRVEVGGAKPALITKAAIVAGGGDETELMAEAEEWGAQAYIAGEWYTRTLPAGEDEESWAEGNRAACIAYAKTSKMALLAFSHAASEFLVMRSQMADFFEQQGLAVICLEQSDWWR